MMFAVQVAKKKRKFIKKVSIEFFVFDGFNNDKM